MNLENNDSETSALKNQLFILLVALIVVSGTLTVYLFRQVSIANKDIAQGQQMNAVLLQNQNAIGTFVSRLVDYGQKHPDFRPVLAKYGIVPNAGMPGMAPAPAAPAPAAPKK